VENKRSINLELFEIQLVILCIFSGFPFWFSFLVFLSGFPFWVHIEDGKVKGYIIESFRGDQKMVCVDGTGICLGIKEKQEDLDEVANPNQKEGGSKKLKRTNKRRKSKRNSLRKKINVSRRRK